MNLAECLHANTYLRKVKVTLIVIGWAWSNRVCPFRSRDSIICCISRMNEWIELIFCKLIHCVRKVKSYFDMHMVKYGCSLLGPEILKSAFSQIKKNWWIELIFCMLEATELFLVRSLIMLFIFGFYILRLHCSCIKL